MSELRTQRAARREMTTKFNRLRIQTETMQERVSELENANSELEAERDQLRAQIASLRRGASIINVSPVNLQVDNPPGEVIDLVTPPSQASPQLQSPSRSLTLHRRIPRTPPDSPSYVPHTPSEVEPYSSARTEEEEEPEEFSAITVNFRAIANANCQALCDFQSLASGNYCTRLPDYEIMCARCNERTEVCRDHVLDEDFCCHMCQNPIEVDPQDAKM